MGDSDDRVDGGHVVDGLPAMMWDAGFGQYLPAIGRIRVGESGDVAMSVATLEGTLGDTVWLSAESLSYALAATSWRRLEAYHGEGGITVQQTPGYRHLGHESVEIHIALGDSQAKELLRAISSGRSG